MSAGKADQASDAGKIEMGGLDAILGLHIRRAHGAVQRHFAGHFGGLGLTQKQISVLWLAGANPGVAQADLSRVLDMDRATTMALVHALEKRRLLARERSESDRRRIAFRLTREGERVLAEAKLAVAEHEAWLVARFTAAERAQLQVLLERIHR